MRILTFLTKVKEYLFISLEGTSRRDIQKLSTEVQINLGRRLGFYGFKNSLGQARL